MGVVIKLIDAILISYFLLIVVAAPLLTSQTCLPQNLYPSILIDLHKWYSFEFQDYFFVEKPHFFVGFVWSELLFLWPLSILNLYALLASKPWFYITCLLSGASTMTSMAGITAELMGSGKASDKLKLAYIPFLGIGILAIFRGLITTSSSGKRHITSSTLPRKKRA